MSEKPPFASSLAHHASDPFRLMVESVKDYAIFILDPAGNVASWNPGAERIKGYKAEEIIGTHFSCFYTPADVARGHPQEELKIALAEGRYEEEGQRVRKDGSLFWAIVTITALRDHFGHHVGFAKVTRDISNRKATEDSLRASEDRYRRLVEMMPDAVFVNTDGMIAICNSAFARLVGVSRCDELLGTPVLDVFPEKYHETILERIEATKGEGSVPALEEEIVRRDGTSVPVEVVATRIRYEEREAILVCLHDVTVRRQAEETAFKLASIIEGNDTAIIGKKLDGTITSWNSAAERLYGYSASEILGKHITVIIPPDRLDEYKRIIGMTTAGGNMPPSETVRRRKDGKLIDVSVNFSPVRNRAGQVVGISVFAQDITEKKRLQEQFRQAQKMEAIGRLAGGIAHDFNNLLTVILGYADQVNRAELREDVRRDLDEIVKAGHSAAALTRQLLAFSRRQILEPSVIDLNQVIAKLGGMLDRLIGDDVELRVHQAAQLSAIRADVGQVEQIVLNLAVNARDAMPHGGLLTIETANVTLDDAYVAEHHGASVGPHIMLAVTDTGHGMDESTRDRLFEPFFTTKERDKGTGLGLATVYGIVKQSGGSIWVYSEPGLGTTFKIYFPATADALTRTGPAPAPQTTGGTETILVVEDQPGVLALATRVLRQYGYEAIAVGNPEEALRIAGGRREGLDLLITDVVMPRMSGRELARRLVAQLPGLRVLYISGYTDEAIVSHGVLESGLAFLQKPFTPVTLAERVRQVLDAPGPARF